MITIVSLIHWDSLSNAASSAVLSAKKLYIQSSLHPAASSLPKDLTYSSMDALYEVAEDFDELNLRIAKCLVDAVDCVYVMMGSSGTAQLDAICALASQENVPVTILPGVTLSAIAFPEKRIDRRLMAHDLSQRIDPQLSLAVEEIDSPLVASEVKLLLTEFYPDEWSIRFSSMQANGSFSTREILLYQLDSQAAYDASTVIFVPAATFEQLSRFGYAELCEIMRRLRARNGCPWDREQTHESLKQPLMEECYELLDAIDEKDDAHMVEELGDVLMQSVFHSTIATEQSRFTDRDVTTGIVSKLIYRHPHIFGSVHASTSAEVLKNWDNLKMQEKGQSTIADTMYSVTRSLPALMFAKKVQKKASRVGFDWDSAEDAFPSILDETRELQEAMRDGTNVAEEMGDLLFAVVNVARLLHLEPEILLREASDKFVRRFSAMEQLILKEGLSLETLTQKEMDVYWNAVKEKERRS